MILIVLLLFRFFEKKVYHENGEQNKKDYPEDRAQFPFFEKWFFA
jgi:hypothetical protein